MRYIYQHKDWPKFRWDSAELAAELEAASFSTGKFSGRLAAIGFAVQSEAVCETLSAEILNSAEIEGERLNRDDVRSSVAKRMEVVLSDAKRATSSETEARADMKIDATRNWEVPMTVGRLFSWHAALFPTGYSGLSKIAVGRFRDDSDGPMRVVSRHVSQDTASREINALVAKGIFRREGQGRSTHYVLREECCQCGNTATANGQFQ